MEKVLVTGGSGYIALHCIAELLKENYHVRTSLRNMERKEEVQKSVSKYLNDRYELYQHPLEHIQFYFFYFFSFYINISFAMFLKISVSDEPYCG